MVLAGDIGGTKTVLGLFNERGGPARALAEQTYPSGRFAGLEEIVAQFLESRKEDVRRGSFGVAGTVVAGAARLSNPPWVAELPDFIPVQESGHAHRLVRRIKTIKGRFTYRVSRDPRFDYGRSPHAVEITGEGAVFREDRAGGLRVFLRFAVPLQARDGAAVAELTLAEGESAAFVFEEHAPERMSESAEPGYVSAAFKDTLNCWRRWIGRSTYRGPWREAVHRSALILKLLTSHSHGSIVAAPTFGLPVEIGGSAIGTIATPGYGTPPSRSAPCCASA